MKYFITGGGTGGSVTPLLAIAEALHSKDKEAKFVFIGPEARDPSEDLALAANIPYEKIAAGKWRRYADWRNLFAPYQIIKGFFQSLTLIKKHAPDAIISAGSFVSVPLAWAGFLRKVPVFIHQQDYRAGLANKLMAPVSTRITVTFVKSIKNFPRKKTICTGNPVRKTVLEGNVQKAHDILNLHDRKKVILILGGGTGASKINEVVTAGLSELLRLCQIIHVAGKGKNIFQDKIFKDTHRPDSITKISHAPDEKILHDYHVYEFLSDELPHAMSIADLVITRAGMATLSELCALGKPCIIIPLPDSHQNENARVFSKEGAAVTLSQKSLTPEMLTQHVKLLLENPGQLKKMGEAMKHVIRTEKSEEKIAEEILSIVTKKKV